MHMRLDQRTDLEGEGETNPSLSILRQDKIIGKWSDKSLNDVQTDD